jgi:hypothetical protein
VERRVTEESNWQPVGDLATTVLRAAAERRAKVEQFKAAAARDPVSAFQPQSEGISVQLSLPLPEVPWTQPNLHTGRMSRL